MHRNVKVLILFAVLLFSQNGNTQTFWTGPKVTITKANWADFTLEENQDRITDSVWLTRANERGMFNIVQEDSYDNVDGDSPLGTLWANGSISDGIDNLEFKHWGELGLPPDQVGVPKVLHLTEEDIYIDIVFTQWSQGGGGSGTSSGGGFTYERSSPLLSLSKEKAEIKLLLVPNPARHFIQVQGTQGNENYIILDSLGRTVREGKTSIDGLIHLTDLSGGAYFLYLIEEAHLLKFVCLN